MEPGAGSRVVLGVSRNVTSAVRLLDALEGFRGDPRIEVLFLIDGRSSYRSGVDSFLHEAGVRVVSQQDAATRHVDLVLTASANVDPLVADAPMVVVPHGVGFHKSSVIMRDGVVRPSGVVPSSSGGGRVLTVVTSHRQRRELEALGGVHRESVVVRDDFFARLTGARESRERYRRLLGVRPGQRLVVVSSTWGDESLWRRWQQLPTRLLAELPADEFMVAAILHPNVWADLGAWQVRTWLADALDSGLLLVPAERGWHGVLAAADVLIGDHGSVTFYGAALGLPVLLGTFGAEATPGTTAEELGERLPWLRWDESLEVQLREALASPPSSAAVAAARSAFGHGEDGEFEDLTRVLYGCLGLMPRGTARLRLWPPPPERAGPAGSFQVFTNGSVDAVSLRRFPAAAYASAREDEWTHGGPEVPEADPTWLRHLACYDDEVDIGRRQSASVMVRREVLGFVEARSWVLEHQGMHLIAAHPTREGVVVAAPGGLWWVARSDHEAAQRYGLRPDEHADECGPLLCAEGAGELDPMHVAGVVYHLVRLGQLPPDVQQGGRVKPEHRLLVDVGRVRYVVCLRPVGSSAAVRA